MKLVIVSIVLDGMPFLAWHLPIFQKLKSDWSWIVVHGTSQNQGSTRWCRPQQPRLSNDGSTEYLHDIAKIKNVRVLHSDGWKSKDEMFNAALAYIEEPCTLMEVDVDEIWKPEQIDRIAECFANDPTLGMIRFPCRYFVGPKLACQGENCWSNNFSYEWDRAWRFNPGATFISHEPPVLSVVSGWKMMPEEAKARGLKFDHLAWVTEKQVEFKSKFYSSDYSDAVNQWRSLQRNETWPAKLSRFFPWVSGDLPTVVKI